VDNTTATLSVGLMSIAVAVNSMTKQFFATNQGGVAVTVIDGAISTTVGPIGPVQFNDNGTLAADGWFRTNSLAQSVNGERPYKPTASSRPSCL